jgi:hypothetical protein
MKKIVLSLIILLSASTAVACDLSTIINIVPENSSEENAVLALEAVSATGLLMEMLTNSAVLPVAASTQSIAPASLDAIAGATTQTTTPNTADITAQLDTVEYYLNMIKMFLEEGTVFDVSVLPSDLAEYAYKIVYATKDLAGNDLTYTLYYNQIVLGDDSTDTPTTQAPTTQAPTTQAPTTQAPTTQAPTTQAPTTQAPTTTAPQTTTTAPSTTTPPVDGEAGASETAAMPIDSRTASARLSQTINNEEVVYLLTGMLVIGDQTFFLEGKKIIENGEEILIMKSSVDASNYVEVSFKQDTDGLVKFFFEVIIDDVLVNSSKIKLTMENQEMKAQLDFIEGDANGTYTFKYETVGSETFVKINYQTTNALGTVESGEMRLVITFDPLTNTTSIEYLSTDSSTSDDDYDDDYDDEDDDDDDEDEDDHEDENDEDDEDDRD